MKTLSPRVRISTNYKQINMKTTPENMINKLMRNNKTENEILKTARERYVQRKKEKNE